MRANLMKAPQAERTEKPGGKYLVTTQTKENSAMISDHKTIFTNLYSW